jgi:flavin prenyltransferase
MKIVVGITGASGSIYAYSLLVTLNRLLIETDIIVSDMGQKVMQYECGITSEELSKLGVIYDDKKLFSPVASGSYKYDGMVIVPCSMNSLGAIANGLGNTLLLRSASVVLKERRKLITVVRETPLSLIHIENMAKVIKAGGCVMPASPGFYTKPTEIWQLVENMVCRILDQLGIENNFGGRWQGGETS